MVKRQSSPKVKSRPPASLFEHSRATCNISCMGCWRRWRRERSDGTSTADVPPSPVDDEAEEDADGEAARGRFRRRRCRPFLLSVEHLADMAARDRLRWAWRLAFLSSPAALSLLAADYIRSGVRFSRAPSLSRELRKFLL